MQIAKNYTHTQTTYAPLVPMMAYLGSQLPRRLSPRFEESNTHVVTTQNVVFPSSVFIQYFLTDPCRSFPCILDS